MGEGEGEGEYGGGRGGGSRRVWGRERKMDRKGGEGERSLKKFSSGKCLGTSEGLN